MFFAPSFPIEIQTRDEEILTSLFVCRVMTLSHVAAIHFAGRKEAAKKRLQKLKAAGLVGERKRRAFEPSVLFLTRRGLLALQGQGILAKYPQLSLSALERRIRVSQLTLQHELEVIDVKATFHSFLKRTDKYSVAEFNTWPLLYQFEIGRFGGGDIPNLIKPDGYIRIHEHESGIQRTSHDFFLEVDRSTEKQEILVNRAQGYLNYYRSGAFAVRHGETAQKYKSFPFRVLFVLKSAERRNNTALRLLKNNPPILSLVWLTTLAELVADPFGAIWIRPRDYRDAVEGTSFDTKKRTPVREYKREAVRERLVEQIVRKWKLLSGDSEA